MYWAVLEQIRPTFPYAFYSCTTGYFFIFIIVRKIVVIVGIGKKNPQYKCTTPNTSNIIPHAGVSLFS